MFIIVFKIRMSTLSCTMCKVKSESPVDGLHNLANWNLVLHKANKIIRKKSQKRHNLVLYSEASKSLIRL
jgi:hypothetical protein